MDLLRSVLSALRHRANALATGMTAALLLAVLLQPGAAAATTVTLSLDAAGFGYNAQTTHLITGNSPCPNHPLATDPTEHNGTMEQAGGYIHDLTLPQGAKISGFRLSAEDNDPDVNVYAYLARKQLTTQNGNFLSGYKVLAHVQTSGMQQGIRLVATSSVTSRVVDNTTFAYFVEIANCASTVNPAGIQVVYTK